MWCNYGRHFPSKGTLPNWAWHIRVAFSSIALKTGCSSPGEQLMMRNTSAVAVCCSNASLRSIVR